MNGVSEVVTWELVLTLVTIGGAVAGVWWRIETKIEASHRDVMTAVQAAMARATITADQLSEFKVEVARTYASKGGMQEMSTRLEQGNMRILDEMTRLHERMDRVIDGRPN